MRLLEYESKEIFKRYGIPIPDGVLVSTKDEALRMARAGPIVLKAQLPIGGRGKAGLIGICQDVDEAKKKFDELLGKRVGDYKVEEMLVEPKMEIAKELYLSIAVDRSNRETVLLASREGGVEIEELAEDKPQAIQRMNLSRELNDFQARDIANGLGFRGVDLLSLSAIIKRLHLIFYELDCTLAEINPLVISGGGFVALDAKIEIDDNALFRHRDLKTARKFANDLEEEAKRAGLFYVALDGDIGIIGNGAGMVMATLDIVKLCGGRPANFCDIGGGASTERVSKAIEIVLSDEKVKTIFMNIFAGITRCDEVARGIVEIAEKIKRENGKKVDLVIRMIGTNEEEGRNILRENGIETIDDMEEGAAKAVELAGGAYV